MGIPKLNSFQVIVRATADPEIQSFGSGATKTKLRAVVPERVKDKSGQWKDAPIWLDIEAWDRGAYKLAENLANQVRKGTVILVTGKLAMDEWTDKSSGVKRSKIFVKADDFQLISGPKDSGDPGDSSKPADGDADSSGGFPF